MQTSKERVISAIEFTKPDRLPVIFDRFGVSDIHNVNWNQIGTGDNTKKFTLDEWGCGWSRSEVKNMGLVTYHPIDVWENVNSFKWPDPSDPIFYEGMEAEFEGANGKYILTGIFMVLFERMHSLRGFINTLEDLYLERENIEMLADKIVEFDIGIIENISLRFPNMIDGISFSDDWGTELDLFINPKLWVEFFKPRYKKIFDACKKAGWHIWLHSCGKVNSIIGELIDIGLDVINLQQPTLLNIEKVGKMYAGNICFLSLCDIQHTLPFKGEKEIKDEAELLIKHWGTDNGGFILGDYGDGEAINVPEFKKKIMYDAFLEFDRWK